MTTAIIFIVLTSLAMGVFGAFGTWYFIDIAGSLGKVLAARRERKRLQAEAKALQEAEAAANEGEGED